MRLKILRKTERSEYTYILLTNKSLFDERNASTEDGFAIRHETRFNSFYDVQQAFHERKKVFIWQFVPLGNECRHEQVDVNWVVEMAANRVGQKYD